MRFLPAATSTPERMTAVLAQVRKAIATLAADDDEGMDPALAACVQLALAGLHAVPPPSPAARPSLTVSAFDMHLHAATTVDGRDRKQLERAQKTGPQTAALVEAIMKERKHRAGLLPVPRDHAPRQEGGRNV